MITDQIMEAIDMMVELCKDERMAIGMSALRDMLGDIDCDEWCLMSTAECREWVKQYLYGIEYETEV